MVAAGCGVVKAEPDPHDEGFGLYVHWPWCLSRCPYCDFNRHVVPDPGARATAWAAACCRDLETLAAAPWAAETRGRRLDSVFFGGGTPSLMDPAAAALVLETADRLWPLAADAEVTLEANPGAVDRARFAGMRSAGVTRLSLGVQALDDAALHRLGRRHDRAEALAALDLARTVFPQVSADLIAARPDQTPTAWAAELREMLAVGLDHLSLYHLTIEPGTPFFDAQAAGTLVVPDEDTAALLFEETDARMTAAGLPAYEVSNHARPGAECQHNLTVWRGGDYVGVGPGAHGRVGCMATRMIADPQGWLAQGERQGHGLAEVEALDRLTRAEERVMMGLRLTEGVHADRFARLSGLALTEVLDPVGLADMIDPGFVTWDGVRLRATAQGRLRLNGVIAALLDTP